MEHLQLNPKIVKQTDGSEQSIGYFGDDSQQSDTASAETTQPSPLFKEGWSGGVSSDKNETKTEDVIEVSAGSIFKEGWSKTVESNTKEPEKPLTISPLFKEGWSKPQETNPPRTDFVPDTRFRWDNNSSPYIQNLPQGERRQENRVEPDTRFNWDKNFHITPNPERPMDGRDNNIERQNIKTGDRVTDTINTIQDIPQKHQQMVVVTTASKRSTTGELRIYDRTQNGGWVDSGKRIPINVGRNGLNWGVRNQELLNTSDLTDRRKVEGDGTGPIGLFTVSGAFGLKTKRGIESQLANNGANSSDVLPYRQIKRGSQWVSTRNNYNVWIDGGRHSVKEDLYKIAKSGLYEYGLVLGYNGADMFNGRSGDGYPVGDAQYKGGSAIFAHVQRGHGRPTAGCTSMSRQDMVRLMATLKQSKSPLWLQIPHSELRKIEGRRFTHPRSR